MRLLHLSSFALLIGGAGLQADPVVVRSPDRAQTFAFSTVQNLHLRWLPARQTLVATVTFSNVDYYSTVEPRRDERFDFALPGITYHPPDRTFQLTGPGGGTRPVATLRRGLLGSAIELVPEARLKISNQHGVATVQLTVVP